MRRASPASTSAPSSTRCCSASASARPASARASPSRTASSPGSRSLFGLAARLDKPIDFEALDGQPVDILFLLLAPEGAGADHLKALARVARALREPGMLDRIRKTRDADALYAVLSQTSARGRLDREAVAEGGGGIGRTGDTAMKKASARRTLRIGIASVEAMKARSMAIARGEVKPAKR